MVPHDRNFFLESVPPASSSECPARCRSPAPTLVGCSRPSWAAACRTWSECYWEVTRHQCFWRRAGRRATNPSRADSGERGAPGLRACCRPGVWMETGMIHSFIMTSEEKNDKWSGRESWKSHIWLKWWQVKKGTEKWSNYKGWRDDQWDRSWRELWTEVKLENESKRMKRWVSSTWLLP